MNCMALKLQLGISLTSVRVIKPEAYTLYSDILFINKEIPKEYKHVMVISITF